jgi:hypothetical protein
MEIKETTLEEAVESSQEECSSEETQLTEEGVTREYDDATFAVLLAMVPLLVFTLFGQVGLF